MVALVAVADQIMVLARQQEALLHQLVKVITEVPVARLAMDMAAVEVALAVQVILLYQVAQAEVPAHLILLQVLL